MGWQPYAVSEFGLLDSCDFTTNLWGSSVAPNSYAIMQSALDGDTAPLVIGYGVDIPWVNGQTYARMPLFYFARYDANDQKIGYVGFDVEIVSNYTHTMNAQVSITITACVRDLNRQIVSNLGDRSIGTAAPATTHYDSFQLTFFLSIGKATDLTTTAVGGVGQIYCGKKDQMDGKGYLWAGIISSNSAWQDIKYSTKEKSREYGKKAVPKGGYNEDAEKHGSFDDTSDTITISGKPTLSVGNSGFVHAYYVTESILQSIGTALFPRIESQSFTGIPEAIDYLTMVMFYNKRTDYILDVLILPFAVPHSDNASRVKVGGSELVIQEGGEQVYCLAYPVSEYYADVDCGTLGVEEYWCSFLDFTGTRFKLFLPAVGYVDLQPEFINGGSINVKYRFNIVDGSFMCFVTATSGHSQLEQSLVAQYSGVWCMHIPITGQDYTNKISGLISSVGTIAAGGMMGGGGAFMGAVNSLANTAMQKPQTTHANGYNASSSFLTHRKPYIIIERQVSQFSEIYPSETGVPCYVARLLSTVHGFTVIENPVLNIDCNDAEYEELVALMKNGIIL